MYKLTKVEIEDGKSSGVRAGRTVTGEEITLREYEKNSIPRYNCKLEDVKLNDMMLVVSDVGRLSEDFIKTSPISEIKEKTDTSITFKTTSSIYKLEKLWRIYLY